MPLDLNLGTALGGAEEEFGINVLPFQVNALQKVQDDANLVKLVNVRSPLDTPMSVKLTNSRIANVYQTIARGVVPSANAAINVSGQSIFSEVVVMASESGSSPKVITPLLSRIELRLPNSGALTEADIVALIALNIASLSHQGVNTGTRVMEMMRGSLFPD